jgi:hypothetical protein
MSGSDERMGAGASRTDWVATLAVVLAVALEVFPTAAEMTSVALGSGMVTPVTLKVAFTGIVLMLSMMAYRRIKARPDELRGMGSVIATWVLVGLSVALYLLTIAATVGEGRYRG